MSKWFVLFEIIFLLKLDSLESNSILVMKFACAILALKTIAAIATLEYQYICHDYGR